MTAEEFKKIRFGGAAPAPTSVACSGMASTICPNPPLPSNMVEVSRPLTSADFNGVPLADVDTFRSVKQSDPLHKPDMLAKTLNRGRDLLKRFSSNKGKPDNIINHYFSKK